MQGLVEFIKTLGATRVMAMAAVAAALLVEEDRQRRAVRRIGETENSGTKSWRARGWA